MSRTFRLSDSVIGPWKPDLRMALSTASCLDQPAGATRETEMTGVPRLAQSH